MKVVKLSMMNDDSLKSLQNNFGVCQSYNTTDSSNFKANNLA